MPTFDVLLKSNRDPVNVLNISCGFMRDDSTVEGRHSRRIPSSVKQSREQNYSPLYPSKENHGRRGGEAEEEMGDKDWVGR